MLSARQVAASARVVPKEAPFTLKQLREAVPAHCFERSTLKSSFYLARDLACALVMWMFVAVSAGGGWHRNPQRATHLGASRGLTRWALLLRAGYCGPRLQCCKASF